MKKITAILSLIALVAIMASCSIVTPVNATGNTVGKRVGTAVATGYLGYLY